MNELMTELFSNSKDIERIKTYIDYFACDGMRGNGNRASMEELLSYWGSAKMGLYQLFGNKMVHSFPATFGPDYFELREAMDTLRQRYGSRLCEKIRGLSNEYPIQTNCKEHYDQTVLFEWFIRRLFGDECLIENNAVSACSYYDTFTKLIIGDKKYTISPDMKPIRFIGKLCKDFNISGFEEFREAHSQVLNEKNDTDTIYLSIHPLDFMTMSESSTWSSCMNWNNDGDYRMGTVEMMNSPCVVVAYRVHKNDYRFGEFTWNDKRWRELFIVTDKIISEVKPYPSNNESLTNVILVELRRLAKRNWNLDFDSPIRYTGDWHECLETPSRPEEKFNIDFNTDIMYNDFGTMDYHLLCVNKDIELRGKEEISRIHIYYSGPAECMWCGRLVGLDDIVGESHVVCRECDPKAVHCTCCGAALDEDSVTWIDDYPYCNDCVDENYAYDELNCDYAPIEDIKNFYLLKGYDAKPEIGRNGGGITNINYLEGLDIIEDEDYTDVYYIRPNENLTQNLIFWMIGGGYPYPWGNYEKERNAHRLFEYFDEDVAQMLCKKFELTETAYYQSKCA